MLITWHDDSWGVFTLFNILSTYSLSQRWPTDQICGFPKSFCIAVYFLVIFLYTKIKSLVKLCPVNLYCLFPRFTCINIPTVFSSRCPVNSSSIWPPHSTDTVRWRTCMNRVSHDLAHCTVLSPSCLVFFQPIDCPNGTQSDYCVELSTMTLLSHPIYKRPSFRHIYFPENVLVFCHL